MSPAISFVFAQARPILRVSRSSSQYEIDNPSACTPGYYKARRSVGTGQGGREGGREGRREGGGAGLDLKKEGKKGGGEDGRWKGADGSGRRRSDRRVNSGKG